jgi:two-component sensor histidine kinase
VKNTLATVQSIAAQTLGCTAGDTAARVAFEDRLLALARAHDVLTAHVWAKATLREITDQTMRLFEASGQITAVGPEVILSPSEGLALSMAFHELATNAAKYGALSVPSGRVSIVWILRGGQLQLSWSERAGPTVVPPSRRGFGSRLLERGLARELGGEVRSSYEPSGYRFEMSAEVRPPPATK